ncbi:MAG: hypothetical protein ACR2MP_32060 [Streptosporangiaceae bacterium]
MAIYSQHANRGKVQILATYNGKAGVTSSTVTSVDGAATAAPIIDALNRISACATMPVSVQDRRISTYTEYPRTHLEAITGRSRRPELLTGAHSLWYEYAKLLLYRALSDLDAAVAQAPAPVQTAIEAELDAEVRSLRAAVREYDGDPSANDARPERLWDFQQPFMPVEGGMNELGAGTRRGLDRVEEDLSAVQLEQALTDLKLLYAASMSAGGFASLDEGDLSITDDPTPCGSDSYFLDIRAPLLSFPQGPSSWTIAISRWDFVLDDPETGENTCTDEPILECTLSERPAESELVSLLSLSGRGEQEQLSAWAKTPVGAALSGTSFVVTERYDR